MMQNYFILTAAQRTAIMAFNTPDYQVDPRLMDNETPGVGINLNDNAADYAPGDPVPCTDNYVVPKRMVDDPDCLVYAPDMRAYLLDKPWATLEDETIFAPVVI